MNTFETIKEQIRETPLNERITQAQARIGKMCKEGRGPSMSVPVRAEDDDMFITTTLEDTQAAIADLNQRLIDRTTGSQAIIQQQQLELNRLRTELRQEKEILSAFTEVFDFNPTGHVVPSHILALALRQRDKAQADAQLWAEEGTKATLEAEALLQQIVNLRNALENAANVIGGKIEGRLLHAYLEQEFPATKGHIPLKKFYQSLGSELVNIAGALASPPPPMVPLDDIKPLTLALAFYASSAENGALHLAGGETADKALEYFFSKHPQP